MNHCLVPVEQAALVNPLLPDVQSQLLDLLLVQLWGTHRVPGRDPQAFPHLARLFIAHKGPFFSEKSGHVVMLSCTWVSQ